MKRYALAEMTARAIPTIQRGHEGGTVRLDVYYNQTENVAYVRLYDFCNYVYEPATGIIELNGDRAAKLISTQIAINSLPRLCRADMISCLRFSLGDLIP